MHSDSLVEIIVEVLLQKENFVYAVVQLGAVHNKRIQETNQLKRLEIDLGGIGQLSERIDSICDAFLHLA